MKSTWIPILVLATAALPVYAVGAPLEYSAAARAASSSQAELVELVESGDLTRGQLANLYAGLSGASYRPPACVEGHEMFTDVPASSPFCRWIEELARRGITGGCTPTTYCPGSAVSRSQMAVFVVKATESCPTLAKNDAMIRVGGFCIDKYEASLWDCPRCTHPSHLITGPIPCNANGQDCDDIWARSVAGVQPRDNITWFQAQAALANSGKRLPTNAEWQMAVRGTPDDTGPDTTPCNTRSSSIQDTGTNTGCVSDWGAFDMVGNLWELVADWVPASTACPGWSPFSDDRMCLSGASTSDHGPGALIRGGDSLFGSDAGPFAVFGLRQPSFSTSFVGFRGAR